MQIHWFLREKFNSKIEKYLGTKITSLTHIPRELESLDLKQGHIRMIGSVNFSPQILLANKCCSNTQHTKAGWAKTVSEFLFNTILALSFPTNQPNPQSNTANTRIRSNQQGKRYSSSLQPKDLLVKRIFRSLLPRLPTKQYCPLPSSKQLGGRKPQKQSGNLLLAA